MSDELVCPNPACGAELNERQLLTTTLTIEACPHCRTEVRQHEGFRWENRDAIVLEDVTSIEEWLDAAGQSMPLRVTRRPDEESQGRYGWDVAGAEGAAGPLPWSCSVEYSASMPHVCEVRLTSELDAVAVTSEPERLRTVCDDHAVQPHGSRTSGWDWQRGEHLEARWGVRLFLKLGNLSQGLFRAVVRRLDAAMRDAVTQFKAGSAG
jgi:hypothetical protein